MTIVSVTYSPVVSVTYEFPNKSFVNNFLSCIPSFYENCIFLLSIWYMIYLRTESINFFFYGVPPLLIGIFFIFLTFSKNVIFLFTILFWVCFKIFRAIWFFFLEKINKIKLLRFTNNAFTSKISFLHKIVCLFIY